MKIENGVLYYYDKNDDTWQAKLTERGFLQIDTTIGKEEAATLARYLLRFAETGELKEDDCDYSDPCPDGSPCPSCAKDRQQENQRLADAFDAGKRVGGRDSDDQQLAREKLDLWIKGALAGMSNPSSYDLVDGWLEARKRYGVR